MTAGPDDRDAAGLHRLLDDLADDPAAPPTTVSALSVIAAAKAAGAGPDARPGPAANSVSVAGAVPAPGAGRTGRPEAGAPVAGPGHRSGRRRSAGGRRRTLVIGGLIAACAVAVAAVVVPLAVSNSTGTTTAGSAADQAPARADGGGADTAEREGAAAAPSVPVAPSATGRSELNQALPAPDAAGVDGTATGSGAASGAAACWPALPDPASAALVAALPAGAFGAPEPLGLGCPADPVGGAQLAGTAPDTQVVVRVTRADPGACAAASSETGSRCVAQGADRYVADDDGNLSVFAYGNGYEVEVGGRPATGIAPIPSGLDVAQLSAAAAAVLAALD